MAKRRPKYDLITTKNLRELNESSVEKIYSWVDDVPLSRPKRNIARDFSDGVMLAELIKHFLPKWVEMHNFVECSAIKQKEDNWYHLNKKVLSHLHLELSPEVIRGLAQGQSLLIEQVLNELKERIDLHLAREKATMYPSDDTEADQQYYKRREGREPMGRGAFLAQAKPSPRKPARSPRQIVPPKHGSATKVLVAPMKVAVMNFDRLNELNSAGAQQHQVNVNAVLVPREFLTEKEMELHERTETIAMLHNKVEKMEQLLRLKDLKIQDLQNHLDDVEMEAKKFAKRSPSMGRKPVGGRGRQGLSNASSEENFLQPQWK